MENVDFKKHLYELNTLGFTIVKNMIDPSKVDEIKKLIDVSLEIDQEKFGHFEGKNNNLIVDLVSTNKKFVELLDNDIYFKMCEEVLGADSILYSFTSTILKSKSTDVVQNMHIDSYKFIPNYHIGLICTIALDDFTDENGGTLYLPGSQNLYEMPTAETFDKYSITTARNVGDVLFFNPRVWHKAGYNNSDKTRYAITAYATRSFVKQRFDFPKMLDNQYLEGLSPRIVNLLGFNACPPDSVEKYYLPIDERPFKRY
jgi:ectoine hydroxylase-related dioxygenase (phytanoyl-CoA dioxygenase family)